MSERFDLMVIGGGPAGYLAAERAARSTAYTAETFGWISRR